MLKELQQIQQQQGAIFNSEGTIPLSFGNDEQGIKAVENGVALYDRSHWGLLQLKGDDCQRFLHNQTTNDINRLTSGQGCDTIFVTSTGRIIDLATVYLTDDACEIIVSPQRRQYLMEWMDRFIFPMDKVELKDISPEYNIFTLLGSDSNQLLNKFGLEPILNQPQGYHLLANLGTIPVRIIAGSGLTIPGYNLIIKSEYAAKVWQELTQAGATLLGENVWEKLRILEGRPAPDHELTEDYNPLEAGLWKTISFEKGCYIGQETIARLNTYKGVKQRLWGIKLKQEVKPGTEIILGDKKVGIITSCTLTDSGAFALGYIKTKAGGQGLQIKVEQQTGETVSVPFLTHEYYQPNS